MTSSDLGIGSFPPARLYLATAYMQQYIPGAESPENQQMAQAAHDQFMKVLEQAPNDKVALASIASLYLNEKKFDEAQKWNEKLIAVDPQNKEAYYSLGWIAWSKWYPAYGTARAALHMRQEDPGPIKDKKVKTISTVALWHRLKDRKIKPWREKNVVRADDHTGVR